MGILAAKCQTFFYFCQIDFHRNKNIKNKIKSFIFKKKLTINFEIYHKKKHKNIHRDKRFQILFQ